MTARSPTTALFRYSAHTGSLNSTGPLLSVGSIRIHGPLDHIGSLWKPDAIVANGSLLSAGALDECGYLKCVCPRCASGYGRGGSMPYSWRYASACQ